MIHRFHHRFATYEPDGKIRDTTLEEHQNPDFVPLPRYWVEGTEVDAKLVKQDGDGNVVWRWENLGYLGFDVLRDLRTSGRPSSRSYRASL